MHLKLLQKRFIKKTAESTDHLIANKIANKTTKNSPWNNSKTLNKKIYIYKNGKVIELRLIW